MSEETVNLSDYVPVGRFYKVISWLSLVWFIAVLGVALLTYKLGVSKGEVQVKLDYEQQAGEFRDENNEMFKQIYMDTCRTRSDCVKYLTE